MNKKAQGGTIKFIVILIVLVIIFMVGSQLMRNFLSPRNDVVLDNLAEDSAIGEEINQIMQESGDLFYFHNPEQTSIGGAVTYHYALMNPTKSPKKFFINIKEIDNKIDSRDITYYKGPIKIKSNEISINKIIVPATTFTENTYTFEMEIEFEESIGVRKEFVKPQTFTLHTTK